MDRLGNKVIDFLDIDYRDEAAEAVCEFLKAAAEDKGKNLAPDRATAVYYAYVELEAYALWVNKPENAVYKEQLLKVIEAGVDLYIKTDHRDRMKLIEDMPNFQYRAKELVKEHFPNAIDEYELDGQRIDIYLPDENLAIEINGIQHYFYTPHFHKMEADFKRQQWLDNRKERKCKEKGITLIRIRYDEELSIKTILSKVMRAV